MAISCFTAHCGGKSTRDTYKERYPDQDTKERSRQCRAFSYILTKEEVEDHQAPMPDPKYFQLLTPRLCDVGCAQCPDTFNKVTMPTGWTKKKRGRYWQATGIGTATSSSR